MGTTVPSTTSIASVPHNTPVKHPSLPPPDVLITLPWSDKVCQMYESLLAHDRLAATNYLALQWRMDFDPVYARSVRLPLERSSRVIRQALTAAVLQVLHPYQQPIGSEDLLVEVAHYGFRRVESQTMQRVLQALVTAGELRQFANPFKGNRLLYCHVMHRSEPEKGDRVVELIRRRSHRSGIVERFKVYRMDGRLYPVVRWQNGMLTFANPEMLVVVERSEPFAGRASQ